MATVITTLTLIASPNAMAQTQALLLDDFSDTGTNAAFGTRWQPFSDRVMGGVSDMQVRYASEAGETFLQMSGSVRLDNNGGFIQVRLPLESNRGPLDASGFAGVAIRVRGQPGQWFIHLRTPNARRPWQYYRAELPVGPDWQRHVIEFSNFRGQSIDTELDLERLSSIAVVAYGQAFEAEIEIARLELVPKR
ncbi:MAG: CIA30 family protein [Wenzhouxiangellaceae bacterium]|nr:CIA30 family protein [Wenzhouxiangellaceae bacterium]